MYHDSNYFYKSKYDDMFLAEFNTAGFLSINGENIMMIIGITCPV
jgi:hypothetical protein